ncbi:hypothetical protein ABPG74_012374, partial [Tetrahymena malaccensis]
FQNLKLKFQEDPKRQKSSTIFNISTKKPNNRRNSSKSKNRSSSGHPSNKRSNSKHSNSSKVLKWQSINEFWF